MKKFTPGPWNVSEFNCDEIVCSKKITSPTHDYMGRKFNAICNIDDNEYIHYFDDEVKEANANLIAAAPDMYEALEIMEIALEASHFPTETKEYVWQALKKARGTK